MGYEVVYEKGKGRRKKTRRSYRFSMTVLAFFAFLMLVQSQWPEGRAVLRRMFIPKSAAVAVQAFAEELSSGQVFSEAFENFCHEVVQNAKGAFR